jgi:hypothetical protein
VNKRQRSSVTSSASSIYDVRRFAAPHPVELDLGRYPSLNGSGRPGRAENVMARAPMRLYGARWRDRPPCDRTDAAAGG